MSPTSTIPVGLARTDPTYAGLKPPYGPGKALPELADLLGDATWMAGRVVTVLIAGAGSESAHVSRTALTAMATAVSDIPLPFEAAQQASLMPVAYVKALP